MRLNLHRKNRFWSISEVRWTFKFQYERLLFVLGKCTNQTLQRIFEYIIEMKISLAIWLLINIFVVSWFWTFKINDNVLKFPCNHKKIQIFEEGFKNNWLSMRPFSVTAAAILKLKTNSIITPKLMHVWSYTLLWFIVL